VPQPTTLASRRQVGEESIASSPLVDKLEPPRGLEQYRVEWLVSFVASARHGGVSAAARVLYRSQPRVSSHVADLEQALGVRLFDRSARPVQLTREGQALLVRAEGILDALRELSATAAGTSPKEVRLTTEASVAAYVYPILAKELARLWPASRLVLNEGVSPIDFSRDTWDLAVTPPPQGAVPFAVDSVSLWAEPLVAVLSPEHPLAQPGVQITWTNISRSPLIQQPTADLRGTGPLRAVEAVAQAAQPQTMIAMVRHGMGIGVLGGLAALSANSDGVVLKPVNDPQSLRNISLCWPHRRFGADERLLRALAARIPEPAWPWAVGPARLAAATG